ncbi:hypothetical protein HPB48_024366 [Haemaphysalis longicornis]|uniref:non-specific serine/threonine protein kinase n=1 Tax=Haemaphysalis longicornis TaxID=44386 RepID=A0A9J6H7W6_HAELO|nr:hypothetical protein HPB48_024366 [Haemaphysalis longicornis]
MTGTGTHRCTRCAAGGTTAGTRLKEAHHKFRGERDRQQRLQEVAKHERLPPHPHCVRFVKAWEEDYRLYIQTELCRCSLASYAQENHSIPERTVWEYLVDLLLVGLSPELHAVIKEMMQPNPNKRPTIDQLLERPEVKKVLRRRKVYVAWRRSLAWTLPVSWFKALWGHPQRCEAASSHQLFPDSDCFSDGLLLFWLPGCIAFIGGDGRYLLGQFIS